MFYGYARVSTFGQSLTDQEAELRNVGIRPKNLYHEKFTGTTTKRPQFEALLKVLKRGDTLVVVKLDRLARNLREALNVIHKLQIKGVTIKCLDPKLTVNNSIGGKVMYQTLLMVAGIERDMIVSRTQEGKRYKKAYDHRHGIPWREGRYRRTSRHNPKYKHYRAINSMACSKDHTAKETAEQFGCSMRTVFAVKREFKEAKRAKKVRKEF